MNYVYKIQALEYTKFNSLRSFLMRELPGYIVSSTYIADEFTGYFVSELEIDIWRQYRYKLLISESGKVQFENKLSRFMNILQERK